MVNSQKWLGEGAKGLLSPGSENGVAPVQNGVAPVLNGFRMVQKTLGKLLLPELKLPFAPSPNHFWEFTGSLAELSDCNPKSSLVSSCSKTLQGCCHPRTGGCISSSCEYHWQQKRFQIKAKQAQFVTVMIS